MCKSKLVLCILFCIPLLLTAQSDWQTEIIPKGSDRDGVDFPDIAYSSNGSVHAIFGETSREGIDLIYSNKSGGAWSNPLMIQAGAGGWYSSAVTADDYGNAHVVFTRSDGIRNRLYYWNSTAGFGDPAEIITNIYSSFNVSHLAIAIDSNQNLHLVFFNSETDGKLSVRYASNISGEFDECTLIDPPLDILVYGFTEIVVDENNNVGVVFCKATEPIPAARTYFSSNVSGNFIPPVEVSMIPTNTSDTREPELEMNDGYAYITYAQYAEYCCPGGNDMYFTKVNATTGQHIIPPMPFAYHTSGLGSGMDQLPGIGGNPLELHIAYLDFHEVTVKKYTYWIPRQRYLVLNGNDGSLLQQPETVYDQKDVSYPSVELDDQGFAHLIFSGGDDPIYATNFIVQGGTMHIADVQVTAQPAGNKVMGVATVTIEDENNAVVPDVTVSGVWSGLTGDSDEFQTGGDGNGTCESDKVSKKASGTFTFTVTDVARAGWTYDPTANVEDSDSAPWNLNKPLANTTEIIPDQTRLLGNYPNPFNPSTTILYQLSEDQQVSLKIYSTNGEFVTKMNPQFQQPGNYKYVWHGTNLAGQRVSSGIYYYTLQIGTIRYTGRMILSR